MYKIGTIVALFILSLIPIFAAEKVGFTVISASYEGKIITYSLPTGTKVPAWAPRKTLDFSHSKFPIGDPIPITSAIAAFSMGKRDRKTELYPINFYLGASKVPKNCVDRNFDVARMKEILITEKITLDESTDNLRKVIDSATNWRWLETTYYYNKSMRSISSRSYATPLTGDVILFFRVTFEGNPSAGEVDGACLLLKQIVDSASIESTP